MRHPFLCSATALPLAEVLEGREQCRRKGWRNQAIDYLPPFGNQVQEGRDLQEGYLLEGKLGPTRKIRPSVRGQSNFGDLF